MAYDTETIEEKPMQYTIFIEQDYFGGMTAVIPDMPGCTPEGDNMEELMAGLQEAVEAWAKENGLTALPQPSQIEPDFSDPKHMPFLVDVDDAFLCGGEGAAPAEGDTDGAQA